MKDDDDIEDLERELEDIDSDDEELAPAEPGKVYRRMSDADFAECKALWETGKWDLKSLAKKYDANWLSVQRRLKRSGSKKGANFAAISKKIAEGVAKAEGRNAELTAKRINETKDQHYTYADTIAKLTMQTIVKSRQDKKSLASIDADISALQRAAKTLESLLKQRYTILGLDKAIEEIDDLPELMVSTLTPEMIEQINQDHLAAGGEVDMDIDLEGLDDDIEITQ